jgi:hypothetical protein
MQAPFGVPLYKLEVCVPGLLHKIWVSLVHSRVTFIMAHIITNSIPFILSSKQQ